jgi:DnaJ-class molecular chaperone
MKKENNICPHCNGYGTVEVYYVCKSVDEACSYCNGTGEKTNEQKKEHVSYIRPLSFYEAVDKAGLIFI